jgi:hypothetical protein
MARTKDCSCRPCAATLLFDVTSVRAARELGHNRANVSVRLELHSTGVEASPRAPHTLALSFKTASCAATAWV